MLQLGIKSRPKREPRANADAYTEKKRKPYPERTVPTRFAQPRWTTVLLQELDMEHGA